MTTRLIRFAIIAVALLLTGSLLPEIEVDWGDEATNVAVTLLLVAAVFGLVNTFIRPIARLVSVPLNILSLGFFAILLNGALLLLTAFLTDLAFGPLIVVGGFPPDLSVEAVTTAAMGSFIISAITAALTFLIPDT
jgi:putative membrane protein